MTTHPASEPVDDAPTEPATAGTSPRTAEPTSEPAAAAEPAKALSRRRRPARATDAQIAERVRLAVEAMRDRKATDVRVLKLAGLADFTDYFVLANGGNQRQVQAIADAVEEVLHRAKVRQLHSEGYPLGQWVLLDYGDFVVHVFDDERRVFYGLDRLWSDATEVTDRL
jgi:ribosome-associated protein